MENNYSWSLTTIDEDYLSHHGVLGQKWGIRRYQNEDGSLTAEGRKRLGYKADIESFGSRKKRATQAYQASIASKNLANEAKIAASKGKTKDADRYKSLSEKNKQNSKDLVKGLSKAEKDFGEQNYKYQQTLSKGAGIGSIGGIVGSVAGLGIASAIASNNETYKKGREAAFAEYTKYRNTRLKDIDNEVQKLVAEDNDTKKMNDSIAESYRNGESPKQALKKLSAMDFDGDNTRLRSMIDDDTAKKYEASYDANENQNKVVRDLQDKIGKDHGVDYKSPAFKKSGLADSYDSDYDMLTYDPASYAKMSGNKQLSDAIKKNADAGNAFLTASKKYATDNKTQNRIQNVLRRDLESKRKSDPEANALDDMDRRTSSQNSSKNTYYVDGKKYNNFDDYAEAFEKKNGYSVFQAMYG